MIGGIKMQWESNSLAHYGIKGQQWGVRRFQNPDGSLTEAGRDRYKVGQERDNERKDIEKNETDKMVKGNVFTRTVSNKMDQLKKDFDLDDKGNPTFKTNRYKYKYDEIQKASNQYKAMNDLIEPQMIEYRKKAGEKAKEQLLEKYGQEALDDIDYYNKENKKKGIIIGSIFGALALALPIALLIGNKIGAQKASEKAAKPASNRDAQTMRGNGDALRDLARKGTGQESTTKWRGKTYGSAYIDTMRKTGGKKLNFDSKGRPYWT